MKYALYPNKLTTRKANTYIAKVQTNDSINLDDIINRMALPGTGINKAQAVGILTQFFTEIEDALIQGNRINLPLFSIAPSMRGVFNDEEDRFDSHRHQVLFNISKGHALKALSKRIKAVKTSPKISNPVITRIIDVRTQKSITALEAHMIIEIHGLRMRFPEEDEVVGLYLVDSLLKEYVIRIISKESYTKVLAILPDVLPEGPLSIKVVTKAAKHTQYLTGYYDLS